jgi:molecular chaperone Hsp33
MNDSIFSFSLFDAHMKGRLVLLQEEALKAVYCHQYPHVINALLLEALSILTVMAGDAKTSAKVSIQISGEKDAIISKLLVILSSDSGMRTCANFNKEALEKQVNPTIKDLFGVGRILFTVDFEQEDRPYQAIVELNKESLTESFLHYVHQSDQIPTALKVFVSNEHSPEKRIACALMVQQLPINNLLLEERENRIDQWAVILAYLETFKSSEALDNMISGENVLFRLFHEANLVLYEKNTFKFSCACNVTKIKTIIQSFKEEELKNLFVDGIIYADCEFCETRYSFTKKDLEDLKINQGRI